MEYDLRLVSPVRDSEAASDDSGTFILNVSDGGMSAIGEDLLFRYYPALSRVVRDANNYLDGVIKNGSANAAGGLGGLEEIDYKSDFANSDCLSADQNLLLESGGQYALICSVESAADAQRGSRAYRVTTSLSANKDNPDNLSITLYSDKKFPLALGKKLFLSVSMMRVSPFHLDFSVTRDVEMTPGMSDEEIADRENMLRLFKLKDDGRLLTLFSWNEAETTLRKGFASLDR